MTKTRLMVIGLDGVGLDLAQGLAERGIMPNLGRLMQLGRVWSTSSALPEVSPVCWTSLFSGKGPGEHGIFGFGEFDPHQQRVRPVDSSRVRAERLWERLSRLGRRSVVLNVPLTFPARPILGFMVSGFVTPDLQRGVYPPGLLPVLTQMGYRPEADLDQGRVDLKALANDLKLALGVRLDLFKQMLKEDWDLFVAVVSDTDRVNHFLWPALHDPGHPLSSSALGLYSQLDDFLGFIWQTYSGQIQDGRLSLLVAADHSFGPIESELYLNPWLIKQGYLQVEGNPGSERILPETKALALDPGRIYLYFKDRFPNGQLQAGSYAQSLAGEIRAGLLSLTYDKINSNNSTLNMKIAHPVAEVHYGAELYQGPYAGQAPDLVAVAAPGFSLRAGLGNSGIFGRSHLSGTHRPQGALALWLGRKVGENLPNTIEGLYDLMTMGLDMAGSFDLPRAADSG